MTASLGILGGMGPLATAEFLRQVTLATLAPRDQDHLKTVTYSVPQIPDRSSAILDNAHSPLAALEEGVRFLLSADVSAIAIPCNTAHHWYEPLQKGCPVPILHIVDSVLAALAAGGREPGKIGLLATTGTVEAGVYGARMEKAGYDLLLPEGGLQEVLVMAGIRHVKAGALDKGRLLLLEAARRLADQGADALILGCTEIPLVLDQADLPAVLMIDTTASLARLCVAELAGSAQEARAEACG